MTFNAVVKYVDKGIYLAYFFYDDIINVVKGIYLT